MISSRSLLNELRGRPTPSRTLELFTLLSSAKPTPAQLIDYHEHLLFFKAYPPSKRIRRFCEEELSCFHERVEMLDPDTHALLDLSGIVGTRMTYAYEFPLARWLIGKVGKKIDIDWDLHEESGSEALESLLSVLMETSEGDAVDAPTLSLREYVEAAGGKKTSLQWLLERMETRLSRESLWNIYDSLLLDLSFELYPPAPSRSLVDDGPPDRLYLWNPQAAKDRIDLVRTVRKPLDIRKPVSPRRGRELLDLVHGSLLVRLREYYGAIRANEKEFYDIDVGRGMRLLLWFMKPEYRLPVEAGLGFLMVKNGVPIGYGGGGMHAQRIEIALNIFETFRGGDAGWIYAQMARVCYAISKAPWLVIRKYQLGGEGNMEGLKSGSFWFYYKMGFRSVDPEIRELAEAERRMIQKQKGYRTSISTLKKLSMEDGVLSMEGRDASEYIEPPQGEIGMLVPKVINERYGGDRKHLTPRVLRDLKKTIGANYTGWSKAEKTRFAQMGLFILAIPGIENWNRRDLDKLIRLCRLKGSPREGDYIKAMHRNMKFYEALEKAAEG